ncbi:MAG: hypothetical protein JNM81_17920 [Rhodospirillaceae bacterium]|nr:hypothetical protein [Rhodospirillaceae bacterium]
MTTDSSAGFGRALVLAVGTALMLVGAAAVPTAQPGKSTAQIAAVFAPWITSDDAFMRVIAAGARPVRVGRVDTIIVTTLEDETTTARLRDQGAWFVLDPIVAGDCTTNTNKNEE